MTTATAAPAPLEPSIVERSRTGGVGTVLLFAGLSFAIAAAATLGGLPSTLVPFVMALGPTVLALFLTWREGDGAVRRLLATAIKRPNRRAWYALIALPLAWALAVVGIALALGDPAVGAFDKVLPAILIVPLVVLIPAFAEEIAWRGYAVTRLLPSMTPLRAALVLGVPWAALHLFLQLPGQMNEGLDWWPTIVSLLGYAMILTWAFVKSGGSVLLVALMHAGFNGVAPLMGGLDVERTWIVRAVVIAAIAGAIVLLGGFRARTPEAGDGHGMTAKRARSAGQATIALLALATMVSACLGYNPLDEPDGDPDATPRPSVQVPLTVATANAVTIDVTDYSSSLTSATSGTPGDGASVEAKTLVITNLSPTTLRLTWVGGPCDSANSLSIDAPRTQLLLVQPECPGDAMATDRILDLEFATPVESSDIQASLQDGLDN